MKVLSLFSGIGAFEKALDNLQIPYELVGYCEIDKYASKSYAAIHGVPESMNLGDITKVDEKAFPKDIDLITYGFPCQDISNAGHMKGLFNKDGTPTRSGLFFDALRIIKETQPKLAIAENVKMLTSKKFSEQFKIVLESLEAAGYNNYWHVLNAKDYGIPQNRERVFIVSIRKDIDSNCFQFPQGFPLELRLKDLLEDVVDEKYYLRKELTRKLIISSEVNEPQALRLVRTAYGKEIRKQYESGVLKESWASMKQYEPRTDGIANTISTVLKDNYILIREATKTGCAKAVVGDSVNFEHPNSKTRRGRVGRQIAQTLTTSPQQGVILDNFDIRYLTPKECFRLMGFDDSDFEKAAAINTDTQLYKQAGNSIVVAVLYYIIKALIETNNFIEKESKELELRMNDYQLPEQILFNYEELKQELTEKVSMYETLVYTDAQIKEAKEDRANLNKLKKALNDERIRREKEYMEPFNDFKSKINEIISIIDRPVAVIDRQVKEYEEKQKQDKMDEIKNFWNSCDVPEGLVFEKIFDSKWLNATVSMKSIHEAIDAAIDKFNQDMSTLANLPEFGFEAQQIYISTLDMNKAIAEGHRMSEIARAKAEREAAMRKIEEEQKAKAQAAEAEQIPGQVEFTDSKSFDAIAEDAKPARQWVKFQAYMTTADALALKDFFNSRNIEFKAV